VVRGCVGEQDAEVESTDRSWRLFSLRTALPQTTVSTVHQPDPLLGSMAQGLHRMQATAGAVRFLATDGTEQAALLEGRMPGMTVQEAIVGSGGGTTFGSHGNTSLARSRDCS
jgi:hypothetical protein